MPDAIAELLVTEAVIDKLGARDIATHDARQALATTMSSCATHMAHLPANAD